MDTLTILIDTNNMIELEKCMQDVTYINIVNMHPYKAISYAVKTNKLCTAMYLCKYVKIKDWTLLYSDILTAINDLADSDLYHANIMLYYFDSLISNSTNDMPAEVLRHIIINAAISSDNINAFNLYMEFFKVTVDPSIFILACENSKFVIARYIRFNYYITQTEDIEKLISNALITRNKTLICFLFARAKANSVNSNYNKFCVNRKMLEANNCALARHLIEYDADDIIKLINGRNPFIVKEDILNIGIYELVMDMPADEHYNKFFECWRKCDQIGQYYVYFINFSNKSYIHMKC